MNSWLKECHCHHSTATFNHTIINPCISTSPPVSYATFLLFPQNENLAKTNITFHCIIFSRTKQSKQCQCCHKQTRFCASFYSSDTTVFQTGELVTETSPHFIKTCRLLLTILQIAYYAFFHAVYWYFICPLTMKDTK